MTIEENSFPSIIVAYSGFTIGRIGVPIFLMISGYLLLSREWNQDNCIKFWKKNWLRLFICTEIWWVIYDVVIFFMGVKKITLLDFFENLLFVKIVEFPHVWYMNMILGLYILIPFVGVALNKFSVKILKFPILFYLFYETIVPLLAAIVKALGLQPIGSQILPGFSGEVFGLYLIMGFLIYNKVFDKIENKWLIFISVFSIIGAVALQIWSLYCEQNYQIWYDNGLLLFASVPVMIIMSRITEYPKGIDAVCRSVAKHSFGIYLLHKLVLVVVHNFISIDVFPRSLCMVLQFTSVFLLTWILVALISRIPKVGPFIFNER